MAPPYIKVDENKVNMYIWDKTALKFARTHANWFRRFKVWVCIVNEMRTLILMVLIYLRRGCYTKL